MKWKPTEREADTYLSSPASQQEPQHTTWKKWLASSKPERHIYLVHQDTLEKDLHTWHLAAWKTSRKQREKKSRFPETHSSSLRSTKGHATSVGTQTI